MMTIRVTKPPPGARQKVMISHISSIESSAYTLVKRARTVQPAICCAGTIYAAHGQLCHKFFANSQHLRNQRRPYGWSEFSIRARCLQRCGPRDSRHGGGNGRPSFADFSGTD